MKIFYIILASLLLIGCSSKEHNDTEKKEKISKKKEVAIKKTVSNTLGSIKKKLSEKKFPSKKEKVDFNKLKIQQIKIH